MEGKKGVKNDTSADHLKPETLNINHQDSIFGNAFGARSFYVVHPEWISEANSDSAPNPLHRPPWPWEQPRYRINMQAPITYTSPAEGEIVAVDEKKEREKEEDRFIQGPLPPISHQLATMYRTTHPEYTLRF